MHDFAEIYDFLIILVLYAEKRTKSLDITKILCTFAPSN